MAFRDLYPFKRPQQARHRDYEIAPSTAGSPAPTFAGPGKRDAQPGTHAQYRLALKSMLVPGLPSPLHVGRVVLHQAAGPIWTQRTHVLQKPGWRPTYLKHMDQSLLEVAAGYQLTVCTIAVQVGPDLVTAMREWRDEALAAVGFVIAILDERIAQEVLAEDLILFDDSGTPRNTADQVQQVRAFPPTQRVLTDHREGLGRLASSDPSADHPVVAAARWYLRAAQSGVTPDAVVFLWIALEALSKPPFGTKLTKAQKKLSDVAWVEQSLRKVGADLTDLAPTLGRLAGLRAEIVHGGVESPILLREGYYVLEAVTRLLLRDRLGTGVRGWSLSPTVPNIGSPWRELSLVLQRFPRTKWRSPS